MPAIRGEGGYLSLLQFLVLQNLAVARPHDDAHHVYTVHVAISRSPSDFFWEELVEGYSYPGLELRPHALNVQDQGAHSAPNLQIWEST